MLPRLVAAVHLRYIYFRKGGKERERKENEEIDATKKALWRASKIVVLSAIRTPLRGGTCGEKKNTKSARFFAQIGVVDKGKLI